MTSRLTRRPPPPLPVVVLTGFLGSGKTTLLNDLLRDGALADTVVLINEFGTIGLDHLLVEKIDGDMLLMASGCLCCTIRGDLVTALEGLLRRRDNGKIAPFARVVIETTGLADPVPVLQTLIGHPYFALRFAVESVVTTIDAVNGAATLDAHAEAVRQIALADRIVVTKSDLPAGDPVVLQTRVRRLNTRAPIFDRARGEATADALLGPTLPASDRREILLTQPPAHTHDHEHAHDRGHAHDRNRHSDTIRSFTLTHAEPISATALQMFLDLLRHAHGPKLLRLKGLVALADDPARPLLLHAVQHLLHPPVRLETWPDDDHRTRIVLIVNGLEERFVRSLFATVNGHIAPDQPDLTAVMANPLAPKAPAGLLG